MTEYRIFSCLDLKTLQHINRSKPTLPVHGIVNLCNDASLTLIYIGLGICYSHISLIAFTSCSKAELLYLFVRIKSKLTR